MTNLIDLEQDAENDEYPNNLIVLPAVFDALARGAEIKPETLEEKMRKVHDNED